MSRTLLKVAGEQNDPLRVKVFPRDFVDKPLLPLILLQFSDKQYISEVKLLLPAIGKSEKNYLASLTSNLEDFCDDTSPQTIDDLYKEFGTPVDTVNSYISTLPTETLIKRIRKSKYLRYFIVTLIIMFACITFVFAITNYRSFQVFKQETVYFTNTDIK